ncbi:MAG: DNA polymerase III subunit beta [Stygiobacter sp.]|nr:MAG: DNA polymerase III subunit beta [Stygiobacter sp.]
MAVTAEAIDKAVEISKQFGASKIVLFGSSVEDLSSARDLDLAVAGLSGWNVIRLAAKLEEVLKLNVDVVSLQPENKFVSHILTYGKVLYA